MHRQTQTTYHTVGEAHHRILELLGSAEVADNQTAIGSHEKIVDLHVQVSDVVAIHV